MSEIELITKRLDNNKLIEGNLKIANNIKDSLNKYNIKARINITNNNLVIRNNEETIDESLFALINLTRTTGNKVIAKVFNVRFPVNLRHKGLFTTIFDNLKELDIIDEIQIIGVSSYEMDKWCRKHKLSSLSVNNHGYVINYTTKI